MPFLYPALGFINLAAREPGRRELHLDAARRLIGLSIAPIVRRVRPPGDQLENLPSYRNHATHLGQLNMTLGAYGLVAGDDRYAALHEKLSDLLLQALRETGGKPLRSYPDQTWPVDTLAVLLSLRLHDQRTGKSRSAAVIKQHFAWIDQHATDPALQLPYNWLGPASKDHAKPRGCDLSLRLCYLPHLDPDRAKALYARYAKRYWLDRVLIAGFAEWPDGKTVFQDIDSGPVVMDVGMASTGLGLAAVIAQNDTQRLQTLCEQLFLYQQLQPMIAAATQNMPDEQGQAFIGIPNEHDYITGFLFGDAMLFYSITWTPWPQQ